MLDSQRELLRFYSSKAFILGLFFIAWSREKHEDEMMSFIRLKSLALTFFISVLYIIIGPFVDMLFKFPMFELTGQKAILNMLILYLSLFYLNKFST